MAEARELARPTRVFVPDALRHLRRSDPALRPLIERHGAPTFRRTRSSYQSLTRSIVYQQLAGSAAAAIYSRFIALYPGGRLPAPNVVARTRATRLRSAGLSSAKADYIRALAKAYADGSVNPRKFPHMTDAEISAELTQIRGIGQWSVDMFLMFGLNRPDVLPTGDYAVRLSMGEHFGESTLPTPRRMLELAEAWRPYRTVASWYMWRLRGD